MISKQALDNDLRGNGQFHLRLHTAGGDGVQRLPCLRRIINDQTIDDFFDKLVIAQSAASSSGESSSVASRKAHSTRHSARHSARQS